MDKAYEAASVVAEARASEKHHNQSIRRPRIRIVPAACSQDAEFVDTITALVNNVYREHERDLFVQGYKRTNVDEIRSFIQAGEIAVLYAPSTSDAAGQERPIGCIRIQRLSPTLGEFGMMAVEAEYRGNGFGKELVRFAEEQCRRSGSTAMQVELLFPTDFEHAFKKRLFEWYTRMGYTLIKLGDFQDDYPHLAKLLRGPIEYRVLEKPLT
ncbi:uncharacterized protein PV09_02199 [Verruconis gallopava]|uniref:N-acetyltransferase domain-containing protein n=1 Tax=Verruconis gallopava TaxID=253628 RepID=A0A0D2AKH6_9PEZI|nr:uncharacterized protein PV09_02199 [Verruconis gallopava]KIW07353.1 hypothetical protein PV09_02199 [Verruconis gallopava]